MKALLQRATNQVPRGFSLGSHTPTPKPGFSPRGMLFVCAAIIFATIPSAHAQQTCSLTAIKSSGVMSSSLLAVEAHITGDILIKANFAPDGSTTSVEVTDGPAMLALRKVATDYIRTWHVNETSAGQRCAITITFRTEGTPECVFSPQVVTMTSLQHFYVTSKPIQTCDPSGYVTITTHRILFIHWKSNKKIHINE